MHIRGYSMRKYEKILLVDDDMALNETIAQILEKEGYALDIACSGEDALDKIRNHVYNLVILDIQLPDINGIQVLSKINKLSPMIKKIVLTGFPDLETAINSVNEKADAYLVKPFNPENLVNIISNNLKQQRQEITYSQEKVLEYIRNRVKELDTNIDN